MSYDADWSYASQLQQELDRLEHNGATGLSRNAVRSNTGVKRKSSSDVDLNATQNIVHTEWEVVDPTPDVHALLGAFDLKFFQGKLKCVELEWSKKMYSCAGICYSRKNRFGTSCVIRLSEPLLKLRSRKDLVETLLHEMIHAYLFVLNIRESNGGHGPNFIKIMQNINKTTGTNITVYHTFYDEVRLYKTHVWRCNGICQHRKPFYGYVRRTCNRAPGPNDQWFRKHQDICGGYFQKISEPEAKKRSNKKSKTDPTQPSMVTFTSKKVQAPSSVTNTTPKNKVPSVQPKNQPGYKFESTSPIAPKINDDPITTIRNIWNKKYPNNESTTLSSDQNKDNFESKDLDLTTDEWKQIDDDILINEVKHKVITVSDDDDDEEVDHHVRKVNKISSQERTRLIREEIDHDNINYTIEIIDDDFSEDLININNEICDTSVIDDIFGSDTLISDFNEINDVIMKDKENYGNSNKEIITCPICQEKFTRELLPEHLDGCTGVSMRIKVPKHRNIPLKNPKNKKPSNVLPFYKKKSDREVLLDAGYCEETISRVLRENTEETDYNKRIMNEISNERVKAASSTTISHTVSLIDDNEAAAGAQNSSELLCPVCSIKVLATEINNHLDNCLEI